MTPNTPRDAPVSALDVEIAERIGLLAINRPEVRNAIDLPTAQRIADTLDSFEDDPTVRVIVVTGRQGFFSAGMDLKALTATGSRPITDSRGAFGIVERPPQKPTIAAVEGAAVGGGLEVALAADFIVASEDAHFGLPEVRRGLVAAAGGVFRLPQRIPPGLALEMIMTGVSISAAEAFRVGLVNRVVAAGEALAEARALARVIAANAPMAVRAGKAVAIASARWNDADAFTRQRAYIDPVRESDDAKEGGLAFVEKREPHWRDA